MRYLGAVIVVVREFVRCPLTVGPYALKQRYKADPIIGCGYTRSLANVSRSMAKPFNLIAVPDIRAYALAAY